MRTMDESFLLLTQSLSGGQARSTFSDPAPHEFGHREKAASGLLHSAWQNRLLFIPECPVGSSCHGRRLEEGAKTGFLIATRELGGMWVGTGEGTAGACCSLVLFVALEPARRAAELSWVCSFVEGRRLAAQPSGVDLSSTRT